MLSNSNTYIDTLQGLASSIDRKKNNAYTTSVFGIPQFIISTTNVSTDVTLNNGYRFSGEVTETGFVKVPSLEHGVIISKYMMPFNTAKITTNFIDIPCNNFAIDDISYSPVFLWSDGANILTNGVSIGNKTYYNWVQSGITTSLELANNANAKTGPFGYSLVFKSSELSSTIEGFSQIGTSTADANLIAYRSKLANNSILMVNLKQNITPYGGNTYSAIQNSVYIS